MTAAVELPKITIHGNRTDEDIARLRQLDWRASPQQRGLARVIQN